MDSADADVPFFKLEGDYVAKIVNVVDGDTVDAVIGLGDGGLWKFRLRLYGINAPEMKPRLDTPDREAVIAGAHAATNWLSDVVLNKIINIKCYGSGKFGRVLAELFCDDTNINIRMIELGHAVPYRK